MVSKIYYFHLGFHDPIWLHFFSDGLLEAPTSISIPSTLNRYGISTITIADPHFRRRPEQRWTATELLRQQLVQSRHFFWGQKFCPQKAVGKKTSQNVAGVFQSFIRDGCVFLFPLGGNSKSIYSFCPPYLEKWSNLTTVIFSIWVEVTNKIYYLKAGPHDKLHDWQSKNFRVPRNSGFLRLYGLQLPPSNWYLGGFPPRNWRKDSNPSCGWGNSLEARCLLRYPQTSNWTKSRPFCTHVLNVKPIDQQKLPTDATGSPPKKHHFTPTLRITAPYNGKVCTWF